MSFLRLTSKSCLLLSQLSWFFHPALTMAQIVPDSIDLQQIDELNIILEEKSNIFLPKPLLLPSLDDFGTRTRVNRFKIVGSTVFTEEELNSVLQGYENSFVTKQDLLIFIQSINDLYSENDYIGSGVASVNYLESDATIQLQIVEASVEDIRIIGLKRLKNNYVKNRLKLDSPLRKTDLQNAVELLKLNNLIENISARLVETDSLGNYILEIKLTEAKAFYTQLSLDNLGSPAVGSFRRKIELNHNNLFGYSDRFRIVYTNTDGSNTINDLSYSVPLNSNYGRLYIGYGYSKNEIIEKPFDRLDIDVQFTRFYLAYRQPIYLTPTQEIALGFAFTKDTQKTTIFNTPFALFRGSDADGKLDIAALHFFQDYVSRSEKDWLGLRSEFSVGVDLFDATINDDAPDSNFVAWRGQAWYFRNLSSNLTLALKSYLQFSDRALVGLEQTPQELFSAEIGEDTSIVRGYRRGLLLADNGVFASGELRFSVVKIPQLESTLQLTSFVDFGTFWNNDAIDTEDSPLGSAGLGLRLLIGNNFRARVDWAIPFEDIDTGDTLQEERVTFNAEYRIYF